MKDVFVDVKGQDDNYGDTVLRRGLLEAVRGMDRRLHLLVLDASADYLSGLNLVDGDVIYRRYSDWVRAMYRSPCPALVMSAGEVRRYRVPRQDFRWSLPAAWRAKRTRGALIQTGVGVANPQRPFGFSFAVWGKAFGDLVTWRDPVSRNASSRGGVYPDWAFALGSPTTSWPSRDQRRVIAVTMRVDRPMPDAQWHETIKRTARERDLELVTYAQVLRDRPRAQELARRLDAEYIELGDSHAEMDSRARSLFRHARYVVSDRVHALIVGATEGALPIGSAPLSTEKLERTLQPAGLDSCVALQPELANQFDVIDRLELDARVGCARQRLAALTDQINYLLQHVG